MNPALGGRVFVFFSWTKHMTVWKAPLMGEVIGSSATPLMDGITGATPLGSVKAGLLGYSGSAGGPLDLLNEVWSSSMSYFDLFVGYH